MENPIPQQPVPTQPQPVPPVQVQPQVPSTPNKFNLNIENIKQSFAALPKNTRTMLTVVAILFLIIFVLLILVSLFGKRKTAVVSTPTPQPVSLSPTPQVILNASRYATDSGVLKIESELKNIQNQLNAGDVKQTDLNLPSLDFDINFNQ